MECIGHVQRLPRHFGNSDLKTEIEAARARAQTVHKSRPKKNGHRKAMAVSAVHPRLYRLPAVQR